MAKVAVVGVGPGGREYLAPAALRAVEEAAVLAGGERNLDLFEEHRGEKFIIKNNLAELVDYIKTKKGTNKVAVLASGDPGLFGILSYLGKHFAPEELHVIPGISAVQYACARLALPWHDAAMVSTHGRERDVFIKAVRRKGKVVALAGPGEAPAELARALVDAGVGGKRVYVCSELSYPAEEISSCAIEDLASRQEHWSEKNYVMVIVDE